jgi:low affinity Fe/Cu permease
MVEWFRGVARSISAACGTWQAFIINATGVFIWLAAGPFLRWSDSWQLLCNTFTTVVTYLLLFLVMNTQSRDTVQMTLKLDAIIAALPKAGNQMITLENLTEAEISDLRRQFDNLANQPVAAAAKE